MSGFSSKVSVGASALLLRSATTVVGVGNFVLVARVLGPTDTGRYFLFVSIVLVLAVVAELGLSQSAAVFPARHPGSIREINSVLLRCTGVLSLLTVGLGAGISGMTGMHLFSSLPRNWMWLVAIAVPLAMYANLWVNVAVGLTRLVAAGVVQLGAAVVTLGLNILLLVLLSGRAFAAVSVYVVVLLAQDVAMLALMRWFSTRQDGDPPPSLAPRMLAFGFRGYAGAMSGFLWMRSTIFILEAFHGAAAVGIFSLAQQVAEKALLPAQVTKEVIYREISSLDRTSATHAMNRYLRVTICALAPVTVIICWLAPYIIGMLFGAQFGASAAVFRVLLIGSAIMVIPTLLTPYFLGQLGRPGLLSLLAWMNVVVNALLALWLVPGYAERGAALALVATQFFGTAILLVLYTRYGDTRMNRAILVRGYDIETMKRAFFQLIGVRSTPP